MQIKQAICIAIINKSDRNIGAKNNLVKIPYCSVTRANVNILRANVNMLRAKGNMPGAKGNMLRAKAEVLWAKGNMLRAKAEVHWAKVEKGSGIREMAGIWAAAP